MDIIKNSMLSLALAGTLTASQFSENAKNYFPNQTLQELNAEKQSIKKSKKHVHLDIEKMDNLEKHLDVMLGVNNRTFEDLFPALEMSLQQWVKDDKENVYKALKSLDDAFDIRMKQYSNLKNVYKNSNVSSTHINKIKEMISLTTQAKRKIKELENQIKVLIEAEKIFTQMNAKVKYELADYWLPAILEKDNSLFITVDDLKNDDFDSLSQLENELNRYLESKTIDIIILG